MRAPVVGRMRGASYLLVVLLAACRAPASLDERWTCDFDATEGRPLDDPDAVADDAGRLPAADCMNTCGPPATRCTRIVLDASQPGALCPVCTF